jgi:hypothetical protein
LHGRKKLALPITWLRHIRIVTPVTFFFGNSIWDAKGSLLARVHNDERLACIHDVR